MTAIFTPARTLILALLLGLATLMSACAPLVVGGAAATTALVATDRRTAGEQVEDQAIEMKFSIEVSLKIFLGTQYHQYGYVKHSLSPGLCARKKLDQLDTSIRRY